MPEPPVTSMQCSRGQFTSRCFLLTSSGRRIQAENLRLSLTVSCRCTQDVQAGSLTHAALCGQHTALTWAMHALGASQVHKQDAAAQ